MLAQMPDTYSPCCSKHAVLHLSVLIYTRVFLSLSCAGLHETLALLTSQLRPDANHKEDMVFLKDVFSERSLGYLMKVELLLLLTPYYLYADANAAVYCQMYAFSFKICLMWRILWDFFVLLLVYLFVFLCVCNILWLIHVSYLGPFQKL